MTKPARATLRIRCEDEATARAVRDAAAADDDAFVSTRREGAIVLVEARARDTAGLRRAVDDVLATLGVSEDVLRDRGMDG